MVRVGCDIGGTFTDFAILDEASGEIFVEKGLTTPAVPSIGLLEGLTVLGRAVPRYAARTRRFAHATTLIANAVMERKGARTALLATRGFRDVLELRRHVRVTTYELWADPPEPLVERALRLPVSERTWSDGRILTPVDPAMQVTAGFIDDLASCSSGCRGSARSRRAAEQALRAEIFIN